MTVLANSASGSRSLTGASRKAYVAAACSKTWFRSTPFWPTRLRQSGSRLLACLRATSAAVTCSAVTSPRRSSACTTRSWTWEYAWAWATGGGGTAPAGPCDGLTVRATALLAPGSGRRSPPPRGAEGMTAEDPYGGESGGMDQWGQSLG